MQSALNIDEPDSGVLLDDMFFADGGIIPTERFIATRVEAELAFVMSKRLEGPDCTLFDVLNATDFVVPALEILDTRIERVDAKTKATRKIFDTIADNAANAGIVLGGRPIRPLDADLRWIGALCFRNGQLEETGLAAGVLNHPATAVAWLANKIAPLGRALNPATSCSPAPSSVRSRPATATQFKPIMAPTARSAATSLRNNKNIQGVKPPCRISRSNIRPISIAVSTSARSCEVVRKAAVETGIFPLGGIRVRAIRCEHYAIADAKHDYGFLDMVLRIGEGRDLATRQKAGEHVFQALSKHLDPVFAGSKFALSFDMQINDKDTSWKRNNIHDALKVVAAHG